MQRTDFGQIFLQSANEVLETMFFTAVAGEPAEAALAEVISVELGFTGKPSGRFGVSIPSETARQMAANFLGFDEVSNVQAAEVVGELSNMLCGTVLSRFSDGSRFELHHPELIDDEPNLRGDEQVICHTFAMEEGTLTMWIELCESETVRPAA